MDFKEFHDGLLSISLIIFIFSITLITSSIVLTPFIGGQSQERDLIIILSSINILFSLYYIWNVIKLEKIFRLEPKNIIRFAKKIGIITLIYLPHVILFIFLLFQNLNNLEFLMIAIIFMYIVLGCFLDIFACIILTVPIIFPVIHVFSCSI